MAKEKTSLEWKFLTEGKVISSPTVLGDVVYFGSADKYLYAVDIKTGKEKWKFLTEAKVISSPAALGDVVYFGSADKYLYAVDIKTGKEKWKFLTGFDGNNFDKGSSSPTVLGDVVYFGSADKYLYAVDIKTGKEKWKLKHNGKISAPKIFKEIVYFVSSGIYAVDAKTGEQKWKIETGKWDNLSPTVSEGIVYFLSLNMHLYALNSKTGEEKWKIKTGKNTKRSLSPTVRDGIVYFGGGDSVPNNYLYAVDAKTGEEKWKFKTNKALTYPAILSKSVVYCASQYHGYNAYDEHIYILLHADNYEEHQQLINYKLVAKTGEEESEYVKIRDFGSEVKDFYPGPRVSSNPIVVKGIVYFGSDDNYLYAVNIKSAVSLEKEEQKIQEKDGKQTEEAIRKDNVSDLKIDELFKRLVVAIRNDISVDYSDALDLSDEELMSDIEKYCTLSAGTFSTEEIEKTIYSGLSNLQNWYQNEWPVDGLSGFKEDWQLNEINPDWNATVYNLVNDLDPNSILDYL